MKTWQIIVVLLILAVGLAGGYVYLQVRALDVEQLSDDLWVLLRNQLYDLGHEATGDVGHVSPD